MFLQCNSKHVHGNTTQNTEVRKKNTHTHTTQKLLHVNGCSLHKAFRSKGISDYINVVNLWKLAQNGRIQRQTHLFLPQLNMKHSKTHVICSQLRCSHAKDIRIILHQTFAIWLTYTLISLVCSPPERTGCLVFKNTLKSLQKVRQNIVWCWKWLTQCRIYME